MTYLQNKIREYYNYLINDEYCSIVEGIIQRVENLLDEEEIYQAINDELIYIDDQWEVFKQQCYEPAIAKWDDAINGLVVDVCMICEKIAKEKNQ